MRRSFVTACVCALAACDAAPARQLVPDDAAPMTDDVPVAPGPSGIGHACTDVREEVEATAGCRGGQVCFTSGRGFPGGYCTQDCRRSACPPDAYCVGDGASQYCLQRCRSDADCRTREGYVCARPSPFLPLGCIPDPEPAGRMADGVSCVSSDRMLPVRAFSAEPVSVSHDRADSDAEAEPSLTLSPVDGSVSVAYLARTMRPNWFGGVSLLRGATGSWVTTGAMEDHEFNNVINPSIVYDRAGALHAAWLGVTYDRPTPVVRAAASDDQGEHWVKGVAIDPSGACAGGCEAPVLAIGPSPAQRDREALYAVYLTRSTRRDAWVTVQRSDDLGRSFAAPVRAGAVETSTRPDGTLSPFVLEPGPVAVTVDAEGVLHLAWVVTNRANSRAGLGDTHNGVRYTRSVDGGQTFAPPARVTAEGLPVVAHAPSIAVHEGRVFITFVTGTPDGRWDVTLARSGSDTSAWESLALNDDAANRCATHGFVAMAIDRARSRLYAIWIDNRFGDATVAGVRCDLGATVACMANERVSGERFRFSTGNDPARWHGTHSALAVANDGTVWAAWSDTRTGGPAIYVARGVY